MTDLAALLQARDDLSGRLNAIEQALSELLRDAASIDAQIATAERQRRELRKQGRRMYALLCEARREVQRHDLLIQQTVDAIADHHIGNKPGVYVLNGFAVARLLVRDELYTSLVELVDSS